MRGWQWLSPVWMTRRPGETSLARRATPSQPEGVSQGRSTVVTMDTGQRQKDAFTQRDGEDAYAFVARTVSTLRFKDLPRLLLLRNDDRKQVEAIQLLVNVKMVVWTRALAFGTVILGLLTVLAAFIARG